MEIDFVIQDGEPAFTVLRNKEGIVTKIELDYQLTLLQIHCLSRQLLSPDEFAVYGALMMPKPACTHMGADYEATHGYIKDREPEITSTQ